MEKIKKILVINFGGIGDEILFLPTLISLKNEFADAEITLALEPRSKGIKDLTDTIDNLILVDVKGKKKYFELLKLVLTAKKGKFDLVVSSGGNKLISILLFLMGIKKRYGYNTGKLSELLLSEAVTLNKSQYACDMYHDLISPLTHNKTYLPEIKIERLAKGPNTVLVHPGVSKLSIEKGMIKTISASVWAQVIDLLIEGGKKVILTGGPDDKDCVDAILSKLKHVSSENFVNAYGLTKNLKELAQQISSAEKFLCSDSAPLHIAVALRVKTYVIFGPTDYERLIPKSESVVPVMVEDSCPLKPCLWERRQQTCNELSCLLISAESICQKILEL